MANILSAGVPFLLLLILTRALTPQQYGEVISFYMLTAVCSAVAGLSLHSAVGVRWLARSQGDPRQYTASAVVLVLVTTVMTAALSWMLAPWFGITLIPAVCALAAIVAGTNVVQGMRFIIWQSREQPVPAATLQVSSAVINIALSLAAVFVLHLGGLGRILGATIAGVLVAIFCVVSMQREHAITHPCLDDMRTLLRFGIPLIPHTLAAALLTSADRFAVAAQLGSGPLGVYGAASQLGTVISVSADAVTKAYAPTMYRLLGRRTTMARLRLVAISYLSIPLWLCFTFVLWGGFLLTGPLLLGPSYLKAIDLSIWFLLGGAANAIYINVAGLFFFTGKTEWISIASVTASVFSVCVATFAVSTFGLLGGGVTYLLAQLVLLTSAWVLSLRVSPMPWTHPLLALRVLFRQPRGA